MSFLALALGIPLLAAPQKTVTGPVQGSVDGVAAPVLIKKVNPKYPHSMFHTAPVGLATIQLEIDTQGVPENLVVVQSSGSDKLDQSALNAVGQYRFRPAMKDGQPTAVTLKVVVNFSIR